MADGRSLYQNSPVLPLEVNVTGSAPPSPLFTHHASFCYGGDWQQSCPGRRNRARLHPHASCGHAGWDEVMQGPWSSHLATSRGTDHIGLNKITRSQLGGVPCAAGALLLCPKYQIVFVLQVIDPLLLDGIVGDNERKFSERYWGFSWSVM